MVHPNFLDLADKSDLLSYAPGCITYFIQIARLGGPRKLRMAEEVGGDIPASSRVYDGFVPSFLLSDWETEPLPGQAQTAGATQ